MAGWPGSGIASDSATGYMYWTTAAAYIRHAKPDPRLALGQIYGGSLSEEEAEVAAVGGDCTQVWYSIPIKEVNRFAVFDGSDRGEITWDGPAVIGWETRHDVWRLSVAALDKLIEATSNTLAAANVAQQAIPYDALQKQMDQFAAAAMDENTPKIMRIASDTTRPADERMREIARIDQRCALYKSPKWAALLKVTPSAIRLTGFWKRRKEIAEHIHVLDES